jgi:hypothetical protein
MTVFQYFLAVATAVVTGDAAGDDVLNQSQTRVELRQECPRTLGEEPLATEYGSAGIMKNLAETPDSIRAVASRLLEHALTVEDRKKAAGCSDDCPDAGVAEVIYRVAPAAFLPRPEQNAICLKHEDETTSNPLRFTPARFANFAEMNTWISDLSQGRGADGKKLYEQCGSNCSPRYTFVIADADTGYAVRAEVLCGLARDKADDQYLISTALRRSCAVN